MHKFLKAFSSGVSSTINIYPDCDFIVPDKSGFVRDLRSLRGDCATVCDGVRQEVKKYKKSTGGGK